jgi:hypothetical protein
MSPQDVQPNTNPAPLALGGNFTAEEAERLHRLRENFHAQAEYLERLLDERRIEFVRWLLETGRIGEQF